MSKSSYLIFILLSSVALTACDKPTEKITIKSTNTASATSDTANISTANTPPTPNVIDTATNKTVVLDAATTKIEVLDPKTHQRIQVTPAGLALANILETMAMGLVLKINDQPKATIPAAKCLFSFDSQLPYYGLAQRWLNENMTPEEIKKFDNFYTGDFGTKSKTMAHERIMAMMTGIPTEHPTTYTPEEKKKSLAQDRSPETKKLRTLLQKDLQGQTPLTTELSNITNKEIDRCNAIS